MGISIDKAIDIMERYEMYGFNSQKDGRNKAIEILRKYQQIEELVEYHMLRVLPKEKMSDFQKDILEVIEDGM